MAMTHNETPRYPPYQWKGSGGISQKRKLTSPAGAAKWVGEAREAQAEVVHAGMRTLEVHPHVHVGPEDDPQGEEKDSGAKDCHSVRATPTGPKAHDAVAARQCNGEGSVAGVGESEQGQACSSQQGRRHPARPIDHLLDPVERPRQERVEQGQGQAAHEEHVLGRPEAE